MSVFRKLRGILAFVGICLAIGLSTSSEAAITAFLSAGTTCGGANSTSYATSGPAIKVSLCVSATTEPLCGTSYRFVSANAGENGRFNITARAMDPAYNFSNVAVLTLPVVINDTASGDLGAGTPTNLPVAPASNQLIATLDFSPQATATATSYVISLDGGFSSAVVDADGTCGGGLPTTSSPLAASFTFNLALAPTITSAAPAAGVVNTAYTHTFTATGSPAPTFSVTAGALPAGLTLAANGTLSGTPTASGPFNFTVTAQNGVAPNATQAVTLTINAAAQTITFNQPGGGAGVAFSASPFASGATASSGLAVTLTSTTPAVCTITPANSLNITFVTAGTCTINANQAGNTNFAAAPQVSQTFTINASAPAAPTGVTATAGFQQASIAFTAPTNTGGVALANPAYSVTCTGVAPATTTVTGNASPIVVPGLTNGNTYACTLTVTNSATLSASAAPVNVTPVNIAPPAFTSGTVVPALTVGVAMATFNITTSGGPTPNITQTGTLPTGVTFTTVNGSGTATLTGTPTTAGSFPITLTATNSQGTA
ncbi:MAG TPA: putative Ig domain-containing protein, partial [Usitatibacteraceae bacterium]|nr:putative Ig domain-containing protein [Usitatibacteraceae bacterium]